MITIKKTKDNNWDIINHSIKKNNTMTIKFNEWTEFFQQVLKADIEQNNKDIKEIEELIK